jgi:hypothetical protein
MKLEKRKREEHVSSLLSDARKSKVIVTTKHHQDSLKSVNA